MYSIFIQQLIFAILSLLFTYSLGKFITSFFDIKGNFFFRLFVTYIIGIIAIVLFYSIIKSHGRTINILLLPIIGYIFYLVKNSFTKKTRFDKSETLREFAWSLLPFIIVFLYQSWFYFDFKNSDIKPLFVDFHRYATFTQSINQWGVESYLSEMNYYFPKFRSGIIPYHYPELWLTSFFSKLFNNSLVNSYYFVVYPILASTFLIGILSLFEEAFKSKVIVISIGLALCFITDISLSFYMDTPNSLSIMAINGQKLAFIYCFILLGFILLKRKSVLVGLLILCAIPIFSTIFLPGICGGILFLSIFSYFIFDEKTRKTFIISGLTIIGLLCGYVIFLKTFQSSFTADYAITKIFHSGIFAQYDGHLTFKNCKIIVSNFISYAIPNISLHGMSRLLLHLPFILILIYYIKKDKLYIILSTSFLLFGAIATSLTKILLDSNQFTHLIGAIFLVVTIIYISEFIKNPPKQVAIKYVITFSLISFTIFSWYTPYNSRSNFDNNEELSFIKEVANSIQKDNSVILVFYSKNELLKCNFYNWVWENQLICIGQLTPKTVIFTLGNPEIFKQSKKIEYVDTFFYNHFTPVIEWKKKGTQYTLETFINHYKIKYFYIKKGAVIPDFIKAKTIRSIESPHSKSKFLVIKP